MNESERRDKDLGPRGMLMDESSTAAPYSLATPQELPPGDADAFDSEFALLDERDHAIDQERATAMRQVTNEPRMPVEDLDGAAD